MGRGRGKGKKLTPVHSHDDPGSGGEEVLPTYKRRGRPQKPLKDDIDEEIVKKIESEEQDDIKIPISIKEIKNSALKENGKKRRRNIQAKDCSDTVSEENGIGDKANVDESVRSNGFRQSGNRRKSKPRRAAEAGVQCKRE